MCFASESLEEDSDALKQVYVQESWFQQNPFQETRSGRKRLFELKLLQNTPTKFNIQIRHAFLFSCFTGLRLSDILQLKHSEIQTYTEIEDGKEIRRYKLVVITQKTRNTSGKITHLPIAEQTKQIYDEIEKNPNSELVFWDLSTKQMVGIHIQIWGLQACLVLNGLTKNQLTKRDKT